jgi:hypothetical protein
MASRFDLPERGYCFAAIVGQEDMKTALALNAVNPKLGGRPYPRRKGYGKVHRGTGFGGTAPPAGTGVGLPL